MLLWIKNNRDGCEIFDAVCGFLVMLMWGVRAMRRGDLSNFDLETPLAVFTAAPKALLHLDEIDDAREVQACFLEDFAGEAVEDGGVGVVDAAAGDFPFIGH